MFASELKHSDIVVIDNLGPHKDTGVRAAVEAAWSSLPPAIKPRLHPIENAFSKLKALWLKAPERTRDSLWSRIADTILLFSAAECANFFKAASYAQNERKTI